MKKYIAFLLLTLGILVASVSPAVAKAAPASDPVAIVALANVTAPVLAVVPATIDVVAMVVHTAPAMFATVTDATSQPAASPWYFNPTVWLALVAFVTGSLAAWQNKEKRTSEKINQTLVLGIEAASKIPEVQAYEAKIKNRIRTQAEAAGVQPALDKIVQLLT